MSTHDPAAAIAANRFGLGARPGELKRIGSDPRGWLEVQLSGGAPKLEAARLQPSYRVLAQVIELRRSERDAQSGSATLADAGMRLMQLYRPIYLAEAHARLAAAVESQRSFVERLVHFWANHFAVSSDKRSVTGIVGAFEREAIRPHVLGSFGAMLRAVEQHPAMLLYLDNHLSAGPNARGAAPVDMNGETDAAPMSSVRRRLEARRARRRPRGLNENLAREILELHTLGVDGGYTQTDVTTFAKAITGWSVSGSRGELGLRDPGRFEFKHAWHEPGTKTLLGKRYTQTGVAQGEAVLDDLVRHPATARHIATKLVRHFVADEPPASVVEQLAAVFRDTDGDLPSVYRALIRSDAAWVPTLAKFKTPNEYIASTYRALDWPVADEPRTLASFILLGQRPWTPGSPAGWPDRAADWDGAAAIYKRIEWADAMASRIGARRSAADAAAAALGGMLTDATRTAIARAESNAQALTLLLAAPEFMRR